MAISIKKAVIAGILGITSLTAGQAFANSADIQLQLGHTNGLRIPQPKNDHREDDDRRHMKMRSECSSRQAVDIARHEFGLRKARVSDASRGRLFVTGYRRGYREHVVFRNVRGCPIIDAPRMHR